MAMTYKCTNQALFVLFIFGATAPQWGQGLLIHDVSRSHTTTVGRTPLYE